jgi:ATP-dependent helicase/nuclease subunit B
MNRVFLGWERPLCETVPAYLLDQAGPGLLDRRGLVVVVPTRQASWRLRAALPLAAAARRTALLGPEIVTPAVLLTPPPSAGVATGTQSLLAWSSVLQAVQPGEFAAFLGARVGRAASPAWALQVARRLQELRQELADGGLDIAAVAARSAEIEEAERWAAMADLEQRYARQLADWHLRDALDLKLEHAHRGALASTVSRVVVAAVPDPPKLLMTMLERWADAGGAVEVLVAAPDREGLAFDAWGRPLPEAWQRREITLRPADLWLEATPDDQAGRIAAAIVAGRGAAVPGVTALRPQLAVGVPDRETVAPLQRELAAIGLPAFDPQNRPFSETPLFGLVQALLALRSRPGYAEVAALLRLPDVLAEFGHAADLLRELDTLQSRYLPVTLDDLIAALGKRLDDTHGRTETWEHLTPALAQVRDWHRILNRPDLATGLREVLRQVYAQRLLRSNDAADAAFQQAVTVFDTVLRELEAAVAAGHAGNAAAEVLAAGLQEATVKPERSAEVLDLEGWLELAWNPAPLLFVAGMNEGFVPDGHVGDLFLPDTLRRTLDLRDDRLRLARDAYVLTALLEQRRDAGQVILLLGKTSTAGDPLRPSRLLFRCPDSELVARAQALFKDPPPAHAAAAFGVSFQLNPAQVPDRLINDRCATTLSPTVFRDYLACPLRFYLRHVLGMEAQDDLAREPDALAFGTLVHEVLSEMGKEKQLWACNDGAELARWLEQGLRERARKRYGARPWLGVELAIDSAVHRLRAFAYRQVAWHAAGWEILSSECEVKKTIQLGGLTVSGRIDRIDRNARTQAVCVLDYKTTDKAKAPQETHLGPPRQKVENPAPANGDPARTESEKEKAAKEEKEKEDAYQATTDVSLEVLGGEQGKPSAPRKGKPAGVEDGKKPAKRWADLQLPLYRELVRAEFGSSVQLGYICLSNALGETGFKLWDLYGDALHASAIHCAEAIALRIRSGVFWPPGKATVGYLHDDLAGLLLGDPKAALCPPPRPPSTPWGAKP